MLKYIFSILLIAAVWTTVLLLELPMWIAIVATAVILAVLLTIVIWRVMRARRAAKEIERALAAQADQHAARARPDLQADIEALKGEFIRAVGALKSSKLGGKRPSEALYALPWYMIIGPPGSGKSTALRNSGLRFPYLSRSGGAVQGVGGTRNCQWWMTNDAVILDTAGRYTTEDSDRDEWLAFLDLIKKNRTKAPINGVMVAIAITDLSEVHAEEVVSQAREIRARIDEVMNKLEMVVPVYVLFTKVDLLPGFVETFGDLGSKDRGQIWGFTFPVSKRVPDPAGAFAQHFTELAQTVERRALRRMTEERRMEARDKIYEFPQYFEPLRDTLAIFVAELLAENIYSESPIMRGCYFTSGTQEGRPIDRIMNSMAEAFGIQPRIAYTAPQVEAKSYFLGDLFQKVIFPDKHVASRTAARIRKQRLVAHGIAAGLILVACGMAVLPVLSFRDNKEMLSDSRDAVEKINEHFSQEDTVDPIRIELLLPLRDINSRLRLWEDEGAPWLMRMGMYQGKRIQPHVEELYFRAVREELLFPIRDYEVFALKKFIQKYIAMPDNEPAPEKDHKAAKDRLRMYLLLTGPIAEGEPGLDEEQQTWLVERITDRWAEALQLTGDVATKAQMREVAAAYVTILADDPGKLFERDPKLVKDTRKILLRTDQTQELLNAVVAEADDYNELEDLDLRALSNSKRALKNDGRKIGKAFTRTAWETYVRDRLYAPIGDLLGDEWVLGRSEERAAEDREKDMERLRSAYFEAYIAEWNGFLGTILVDYPSGFNEALEMANDLTSGDPPPFKRLCQNLGYHTELLEPEPEVDPEAEDDLLDAAKEGAAKAVSKKGGKAGRAVGDKIRKTDLKRDGKKKDPRLKYEDDVKKKFEKLVEFGFRRPPPAAEGAAPPPPPAVPLDDYQEEIKRVRDALKAKIDADGPEEQKSLQSAVKSARTTVDSIINDTDTGEWGPTLEKWLRPPIKELGRLVDGSVADVISVDYCAHVVKPYDALAKYYPFNPKGRDVELAKVTGYFAPEKGELWSFYSTTLASRVPKKHNSYEVEKRGAASTTSVNPAIARFLERADDLTVELFPPGADKPLFEFDVQIESGTEHIVRTSLLIDGTQIEYKNGPYQWKPMSWPGEKDPKAQIEAQGLGVDGKIKKDGEWAFFRVLEEGTASDGRGTDVFTMQWDLRTSSAGIVNMRFRPAREDTPLFGTRDRPLEFMQSFRHPDLKPPRQLFIGGKTCAGGE